jgi:hypothetical protein
MAIPDSIRESLRSSGKNAASLGVQLTKEFLREAKHLVAGTYLMPPFRKYEVIAEILEALS